MAKKVYCRDCKHCTQEYAVDWRHPDRKYAFCDAPGNRSQEDTWFGQKSVRELRPDQRNKCNDCELYEEKNCDT